MKLKSAEIETTVGRKFVGSTRSVLRKEYRDAIAYLAPTAKKMLWYCGAKLTYIIERWGDWKMPQYPNGEWIYLRLIDFCAELIGEHSIHCIRSSLELLEEIGIITIRRNWRYINNRNGQDRTYQYRLNRDRLKETLARLEKEGQTAQRHISSRIGRCEFPEEAVESPVLPPEHREPNVASHTQIPYTDSCTDSCTLKSASEEFFEEFEEFEELAKEVATHNGYVTTDQVDYIDIDGDYEKDRETFLKQQTNHEGQFSAAPRCFTSIEERDNFYLGLIELGKHKSGVKSPVSWAGAIMKSIAKGEPCIYLDEFRRGEKVGTCEKQEWEIAPGRPYDNFVTYLRRKMQPNYATPEQATQAVFKALADVNQARILWNDYKNHLINLEQEWEKQRALGVTTPYIPAEVLPQKEVSVEQAAAAIANLVEASKINAIAPEETVNEQPTVALEETVNEQLAVAPQESVNEQLTVALEETINEQPAVAPREAVNEQPAVTPQEVVNEQPAVAPKHKLSKQAPEETEDERHQRVFAQIAAHNIMLRFPKQVDFVQRWVEQNSDLVRFNEDGQIVALPNLIQAKESWGSVSQTSSSSSASSGATEQPEVEQGLIAPSANLSPSSPSSPSSSAPSALHSDLEETVTEEQVSELEEHERRLKVLSLIDTQNGLLKYPMSHGLIKTWVEQNSDLVRFNEDGRIVAIANEQEPVTAAGESATQTDESNIPTKDSGSPAQQAQVKAAKKFIGQRPATGLVGRKLEMIAPGTEVEETGELHSRDDVIYVKPVGCDWKTGIAVHISLLE